MHSHDHIQSNNEALLSIACILFDASPSTPIPSTMSPLRRRSLLTAAGSDGGDQRRALPRPPGGQIWQRRSTMGPIPVLLVATFLAMASDEVVRWWQEQDNSRLVQLIQSMQQLVFLSDESGSKLCIDSSVFLV